MRKCWLLQHKFEHRWAEAKEFCLMQTRRLQCKTLELSTRNSCGRTHHPAAIVRMLATLGGGGGGGGMLSVTLFVLATLLGALNRFLSS